MQGKKILLGISGSIAAYKMPELVRQLTKLGAEVQVMMTPQACDFVSPLVLGTLTRKKVLVHMFEEDTWSNHVMLGRWADCLLLAPASCNTIAKLATGLCDNFLLATCLSATCPILLAPAMDEDMMHHPATKRNLVQLQKDGIEIISAAYGELASGLIGDGRLADLDVIVKRLQQKLNPSHPLANKHVVITAGPTYENLDPVRFIGNYSTGKMGMALAEELAQRGAQVHLVLGPSQLKTTHKNIQVYPVTSGEQMYKKTTSLFKKAHIAICSAAVADFRPKVQSSTKIKKGSSEVFTLELVKNKDILSQLGASKTKDQYLVGFALETNDTEAYAKKKLKEKKANMIVLNSLQDAGAGFGGDTNKVDIFLSNGQTVKGTLKTKAEVAADIVSLILSQMKLTK